MSWNEEATPGPDAFPCLEQPTRVTLHCRTGHYLWAFRNGKVVGRQRRNDKDEFCLKYVQEGIVEIRHHKFGGTLRVVDDEVNGGYRIVCVKDPSPEGTPQELPAQQQQESGEDTSSTNETPSQDEEEEEEQVAVPLGGAVEDRQWCFVRGASGEGGIMLKSLKTGDHLAMDSKTKQVVLAPAEAPGVCLVWDTECVTGELCFLSNPALAKRIRCDMAGLLGLTDAWKGWEVFRIMETGSHHYVKISSWMHSQWILCSTAEGEVTCCSHAESLQQTHSSDQGPTGRRGRCSQWAIERAPNGAFGVVLRSKTHGRLLSVQDGVLRTYSPNDASRQEGNDESNLATLAAQVTSLDEEDLLVVAQQEQQQQQQQQQTTNPGEKFQSAMNNMGSATWWRNSWNDGVKSMNASMRDGVKSMNASMRKVQKRLNADEDDTELETIEEPPLPEAETLVWQLESAHRQTYYFLSVPPGPAEESVKPPPPRSIGPFPYATANLRQTDKIQVQRTDQSTKLYLIDKEEYIACASDGSIDLVGVDKPLNETAEAADPPSAKSKTYCTDWVMEKPEDREDGGSVFRSMEHPFYLSYLLSDGGKEEEETPSDTKKKEETAEESPKGMAGHFKNPFGGKPEPVAQLVGADAVNDRSIWNLEPAMPRAVSSDKIKTFAIGTSIAVGTTIAMPFALAGASAVLGAVGAETGVLFNVIAAGLTGAEALASVGAIGATAYIVFRPEENSLTDSHLPQDEEEEGERAWSKRPFCNWRNW